ncbi:unnamed protein product [Leuciscus chuanchicus]
MVKIKEEDIFACKNERKEATGPRLVSQEATVVSGPCRRVIMSNLMRAFSHCRTLITTDLWTFNSETSRTCSSGMKSDVFPKPDLISSERDDGLAAHCADSNSGRRKALRHSYAMTCTPRPASSTVTTTWSAGKPAPPLMYAVLERCSNLMSQCHF